MENEKKKMDRYHYVGTVILGEDKVRAIFADTYIVRLDTLAGKFNISAAKLDSAISSKIMQGKSFKGIEVLSVEDLNKKIEQYEGVYNTSSFKKAIDDVTVLQEAMDFGNKIELVKTAPGSYHVRKVDSRMLPQAQTPRG